jgi:prevent-host-death family protein
MYSHVVAKIIPLTEARATLSDLLDRIEDGGEHVVITRKGRPVALMLSPDEWESVELTLETLGDAELLDQLERGESDVEGDQLVRWDEVRARYIRD